MIRSVKGSRQRCSAYLDKQKNVKNKTKKNYQIEILNTELQDVISKEGAIVRSTKCLDDEFVELVRKSWREG